MEPGELGTGDSRRGFMRRAIAAIVGLIGVSLIGPLVGYVVSPALRRREGAQLSNIGTAVDLSVGQPREMSTVVSFKDGWMETKTTRSVWAVKKESGEVIVYNPHCTHLGCAYGWNSGEKLFKCPCHGGVYDIDGKVLAGPPPRPLDRMEYQLEEGNLLVQYQDFRAGIPKKLPI